ncbi:MAG: hypothetical protein H6573_28765 [Lewinellaceae bacterium]|nr:hypothetical protein [Phaeodactylibacter sp.]MCB0612854.1 hypothetical protein [Phaeodactylibacter sp.]MCB9351458.1 hypothetical protein [Lewinellaceae bacterium]
MNHCFLILAIALIATSCKEGASNQTEEATTEQRPLREVLPGVWESTSIRVEVNTAENTDSSYVFEVKEEEWAERLGSRPIRFYFQLDNKYRQEFVALNDEVMSTARGIWNTFGDTLMLIEPNATYQYQVVTGKGLAEFRTMLDWDGDGQEDDSFLGTHRQISRTTE